MKVDPRKDLVGQNNVLLLLCNPGELELDLLAMWTNANSQKKGSRGTKIEVTTCIDHHAKSLRLPRESQGDPDEGLQFVPMVGKICIEKESLPFFPHPPSRCKSEFLLHRKTSELRMPFAISGSMQGQKGKKVKTHLVCTRTSVTIIRRPHGMQRIRRYCLLFSRERRRGLWLGDQRL